jgi:hypothetical protein
MNVNYYAPLFTNSEAAGMKISTSTPKPAIEHASEPPTILMTYVPKTHLNVIPVLLST